jgi:hypothetical protein
LTLPLDAITETLAVLGIRGSGKTNTAAVYAEELLARGQQIVVLDPTDAWWGLKASADGQGEGYPVVVLGGRHQDLPLSASDGRLLADFVVAERASVVLSLRGFESKNDELRFTAQFLRRLYFLKGQQDAPTPLAVIIDEASRLVPQRVDGEAAACVGAVQQIVRQGRSSGFGIALIDQRAATVNKDVLSMLELLIVHRTTGPQDRKALQEWVEAHDTGNHAKEFLGSLASLTRGEAWFWSPGWLDLFRRVQVRHRRTFDSSYTPRAGEQRVTPRAMAAVDVEALRATLAATIEKAKQDDPAELRRQIQALERERDRPVFDADPDVSALMAMPAVRALLREEWQRGYGEAQLATLVALTRDLGPLVEQMASAAQPLLTLSTRMAETLDDAHATLMDIPAPVAPVPAAEVRALRNPAPANPVAPVARSRRTVPAADNDGPAPAAQSGNLEQRMLDALRTLRLAGVDRPSRRQLAAMLGYAERTKSFTNQLYANAGKGNLEHGDGCVWLTDQGVRLSTPLAMNRAGDLHELWYAKLDSVARTLLRLLINERPRRLTRDGAARALGYENPRTKSFTNALYRLSGLGLAEHGGGKVWVSETLFPPHLNG